MDIIPEKPKTIKKIKLPLELTSITYKKELIEGFEIILNKKYLDKNFVLETTDLKSKLIISHFLDILKNSYDKFGKQINGIICGVEK